MSNIKNFIVNHLKGSKSNQIDQFDAAKKREWVFGRTSDADIRFNPVSEDMVSRSHAKVYIVTKGDADQLMLEDMGSTNGTYLNGERISAPATLALGDEVSFGENGPKVTMDLDPRPEGFIKGTRVMKQPAAESTPTVLIQQSLEETGDDSSQVDVHESGRGVGAETLQREISRSKKSNTRNMVYIAAALLVIIAAALWYFSSQNENVTPEPVTEEKPMSPADIAAANADKVPVISVGWKLVYTPTGEDIYHYYTTIEGKVYPVYITTETGAIEPYLVTQDYTGVSKRIALQATGSGFVISDDGFIMTNRHVAAGWEAPYPLEFPGALFKEVKDGNLVFHQELVKAQHVGHWIPTRAQSLNRSPIETDRSITGDMIFMNVQLPGSNQPLEAIPSNHSLTADVAIIKINTPKRLTYCTLSGNAEVNLGDEITVLGHPGNSPDVYRRIKSEDIMQRNVRYVRLAEPTLTNGTVAKVHDKASDEEIVGVGGNVYQLNINTTGGGNSGGPVFNDRGEVIGIYTYSYTNWQEMIKVSFAVPIKYGLEIM